MKVRIDPQVPKTPKTCYCTEQLATASYNSPRDTRQKREPSFWVFSREPIQFSLKNLDFDPLCPKFIPQTLLLVNIHPKAIKTTTNMKSYPHFTSKSSFSSFFTKSSYFSIFIQTSQTTKLIQTPKTYKHV